MQYMDNYQYQYVSVCLHGLGVPRGILFFDMYAGDIVLDKKKKKLYIIVVGNMNFEDNNGMPIPPIGGSNEEFIDMQEAEDLILDNALYNSYLVLTKKYTFEEIMDGKGSKFSDKDHNVSFFAHDPESEIEDEIIEIMLQHYEDKEDYEKCVEIKEYIKK